MDRLEPDDVLVVTKMDRLGRNAMNVAQTVDRLAGVGVRVHCLALGGVDLTSAAGRMTMGAINAVAQFERDLLIERTRSGLARAKAEGTVPGRPVTLDATQRDAARRELAAGASVSAMARKFATSRQTIMRARDAGSGLGKRARWHAVQRKRVSHRRLVQAFLQLAAPCQHLDPIHQAHRDGGDGQRRIHSPGRGEHGPVADP